MILSLSLIEYFFLGLILLLYWLIKSSKAKVFLLFIPGFYLLYSFGWIAVFTVLSLIIFVYFFGKKIGKIEDENIADKTYWAVFLGLLMLFIGGEYLNDQYLFFGMGFGLLIFQLISFVSDVFFGRLKDNYNWYTFLGYFIYFPKYAVGPVENTSNLFRKLNNPIVWDKSLFEKGFFLILIGLFKKIVIADNILGSANSIFNSPQEQNLFILWPKAFFNFLRIYSDFSGMIDVILGVSCLFGLDLLINFNNPLRASGFRDYWNRWHISLSKWVLEYFFKPLSFQLRNITKKFTGAVVVILSFGVMSIWHGYNWSYFIFGLLHALFIIVESAFNIKWIKENNVFIRYLSHVFLFMIISFITLFFTEESVSHPINYLISLFNFKLLLNPISINELQTLLFGIFLFVILFQTEKMYSKIKPLFSYQNIALLTILYLFWPKNPQNFIYQF
jgi:alginate O-acetyltransferase complex protein AlgI